MSVPALTCSVATCGCGGESGSSARPVELRIAAPSGSGMANGSEEADLPARVARHRVPFDRQDQPYRFGRWTVLFPSQHAENTYVWYGDGLVACEMWNSSNGWWHWLHSGVESIVWSSGDTSAQSFDYRPWESLPAEPPAYLDEGDATTREGNSASVKLRVSAGRLEVELSDGGTLRLSEDSPDIDFLKYDGKKVLLRADQPGP